ncbi:uncharacterized protein AB9W97_011382 isoform 2-T2 [Spinachia spinachia]
MNPTERHAEARRDYAGVRKAIVDRLGLSEEDHPFAFAQRLRDTASGNCSRRGRAEELRWWRVIATAECAAVELGMVPIPPARDTRCRSHPGRGSSGGPPRRTAGEAMVKPGCTQSMTHQRLVRPGHWWRRRGRRCV